MAFNPFPAQVSPVEVTDLPEKVSPVGNDEIQISDSENSNAAKKIKISSLPSGGGGGSLSLDGLTDVSVPSPTNGQALVYNNSTSLWTAQTISSGGSTTLDGLTDVSAPSPTNGQALIYNTSSSQWVAQTLSSGVTTLDGLTDVFTPFPSNGEVLSYSGTQWTNISLTKNNVGLGNVDNTSDANKPVSTATQTALNTKQNTLVSGTNIKTVNGSSIVGSGDLAVTVEAYSTAAIPALDIDWNSAGVLYKDISTNSTFTFSNVSEGKAISVILTNTSGSSAIITFPSGIYKELGTISIAASSAAIFSFIRANSKTYLASLKDLTNI
jgi:hypothetical protein